MTLCGLLFGIELPDLVQKMKDRNVENVDIVVDLSVYEFDSPRYSVRVDEISRVNGKPALFSDRIIYQDYAYDGERFFSTDRTSFHYPVAGRIAFETAELLQQNGIVVTIGGKVVDAAKNKFKDEIDRAIACNLSGL